MGFFRKDETPRWVDQADLGWTPEAPLFYGEGYASDPSFGNFAASPRPAVNANRAPRLLLPRLAIGLAQGLALFVLIRARELGLWPAADPGLFAALSLPLLLAPLLLLDGLGAVRLPLLLAWTGCAAALLAWLGLYHHGRIQGPEQSHAGLALVLLTGLMLAVAQTLMRAGAREGKVIASYTRTFDAAWMLAARLVLWTALTGLAWALVGSGNSLFNALRAHYPAFRPEIPPSLVVLPLVAMASALAFALPGRLQRLMRKTLLACFTLALPLLTALAFAAVAANLLFARVTALQALLLALLLLVGINASYRGEARRPAWRRWPEFAASFAMAMLVALAVSGLHARVAALGWTDIRLYAAAATAILGLYAVAYCVTALIALGGGRWMQRIEIVNPVLALLVIGVCLALATPLADPLALAAKTQAARVADGRIDPALFDYAWLRRDAGRAGQEALAALAKSRDPETARRAAITLSTAPARQVPPPTQIGANITVRTAGARLPAGLLGHAWPDDAATPPCLLHAAQACDAWFLDLDGDGAREILLVWGTDARWWASILKQRPSGWTAAATLASPPCRGSLSAMRAGNLFAVEPAPTWQDLLIAGFRVTPRPVAKPMPPCPRP